MDLALRPLPCPEKIETGRARKPPPAVIVASRPAHSRQLRIVAAIFSHEGCDFEGRKLLF